MVEDFHFFTKICNCTFTHIKIYRLRDRGCSLFNFLSNLVTCVIVLYKKQEGEEFSNEQTKIANNENVGTKATAIKRHLKFILSGSGMAISIIFLILIKLISTFFPTSIARQAESGTWYTGFIGFIDYYDLYGIVNIALLLFMLSFTFFSFFNSKTQ